jgi:hypothetical protein
MSYKSQYVTEDKITVYEGDMVYDYYGMVPVIIGLACGAGWFNTESVEKPGFRSKSGMLNGARICSIEFAAKRDFPGAKNALEKL